MPRTGEQAGRYGRREASSEAETRSRGRDPRARRELVRGAEALDRGGNTLKGATPSSEAGSFVARCPPLERGGGALEGYWGW
jgi:hypothetical protein